TTNASPASHGSASKSVIAPKVNPSTLTSSRTTNPWYTGAPLGGVTKVGSVDEALIALWSMATGLPFGCSSLDMPEIIRFFGRVQGKPWEGVTGEIGDNTYYPRSRVNERNGDVSPAIYKSLDGRTRRSGQCPEERKCNRACDNEQFLHAACKEPP